MLLHVIIIVGMVVSVVDLVMTFCGRPLIKPGPLAKSMYPGLDNDD